MFFLSLVNRWLEIFIWFCSNSTSFKEKLASGEQGSESVELIYGGFHLLISDLLFFIYFLSGTGIMAGDSRRLWALFRVAGECRARRPPAAAESEEPPPLCSLNPSGKPASIFIPPFNCCFHFWQSSGSRSPPPLSLGIAYRVGSDTCQCEASTWSWLVSRSWSGSPSDSDGVWSVRF